MSLNVSIDVEFRRQILDMHAADKLKYCYQCNHCSYSCPISKIVGQDRYNPRRLILNSYLGFKGNVMGKKNDMALWGCTVCETCYEVCPNRIDLTGIFYLLKNMSVKAGEAPEHYTLQAKAIFDSGKAISSYSAIERRRKELGLKPLPEPPVQEIQTIFKEFKIDQILPK